MHSAAVHNAQNLLKIKLALERQRGIEWRRLRCTEDFREHGDEETSMECMGDSVRRKHLRQRRGGLQQT